MLNITPRGIMHTRRHVVSLLTIAFTAVGAVLLPAAAATAANATTDHPPDHVRVQAALDRAVTAGGAPGIVAQIHNGHDHWFGSAGLSDTATRRPRTPDERFRIGSTTKAFTATVVL